MNLLKCGDQQEPRALNSIATRHFKVEPTVITMSTTNEPTRWMSTRSGAKDKMAKIVRQVNNGGIEQESPEEGTTMVLANNEGMETQNTQPATPATQKTANTTRAKKRKSSKKGSMTKSAKATKKSKTSKEGDTEAQTAITTKLAALKDTYLKAHEVARSSHPHHWTGKVPGDHMF